MPSESTSPPLAWEDDWHARALAAERTVEVLKRKVVDLYSGRGSSLQKQLESARRREDDNRRKRELSELRATELKRYSETLEEEVRRRTLAMKTILDHVTFGFLVVARDLVVLPECTRSCHALFGAAAVAGVSGASLPDLLGLTARDRQQFELGVDQVFEDLLPDAVSLAQLRSKFAASDGRTLHVEGSVIRDADGGVTGLLFTVSDITTLEALASENQKNRTLVGILRQRESFRSFVFDAKAQIAAALKTLEADEPPEARQTKVRRSLHTIKGNSASYGLDAIASLVHRLEEEPTLSAAHVKEVEDTLRRFLESNGSVLEVAFEQHASESQFARTRHAWQLLGPVEDFATKLAARLGKEVDFRLEGADVPVDVDTMRPVLQAVSHLVRNAIDHGIEASLARTRAGKALSGQVSLRVSALPRATQVDVEDDGRGIDVELLMARAASLGLVSRDALGRMKAEDRLDLVFVDGLSSAEVLTQISGRGVGMSAVKVAAEAAGGTIAIESTRGKGTRIRLVIPTPPPPTRDESHADRKALSS